MRLEAKKGGSDVGLLNVLGVDVPQTYKADDSF